MGMSIVILQTTQQVDAIIAEAVSKHEYITLTQTGTPWNLFKARFSRVSDKNIEITNIQQTFGKKCELHGKTAVAFRFGHRKIIFQSKCCSDLLEFPSELTSISRRIFNREIPTHSVAVKFWAKEQVYRGHLQDISGGGMRVETDQEQDLALYNCVVNTHPQLKINA